MKFRFTVFFTILFILSSLTAVSAQVDSAIAQITSSTTAESFVGGMSGDGRFVVFESIGNLATENPRNTDGNLEIFLFDYAQRRIFQITDTKNLLNNTANPPNVNSNIKVAVASSRPVISNDGKWLAFGSNATCNYPGNGTTLPAITGGGNPGSFDPNTLGTCIRGTGDTATNNLPNDGNTEMWLYRIPDYAPADISQGLELSITNLSGGTFVQLTNTLPSRQAVAGTDTVSPLIADDNRNASINDDGGYLTFQSNRDLEPCLTTPSNTCGNASPNFNNDEVFLSIITGSNPNYTFTNKQITKTPKGTIQQPSNNNNPTISGNGLRIAFISTANSPVPGTTGGTNTDFSEEIFYTDIVAGTTTNPRQITQTTPSTPGGVVNIFNYGKSISRDGRYIAFDSYAELETANSPIQTSFATYLFDTMPPMSSSSFIRVLPRSTADTAAIGGDVWRYPVFTDYNGLEPGTLVFETRMNITPSGTIPGTANDGLNPDPTRPAQIYSSPLSAVRSAQSFKRLTKLPAPSFLTIIQPITSDSVSRLSFSLSLTEPGTGNFPDLGSEAFYLLTPIQVQRTAAGLNFATGASRIPVVPSPVPTPSPTATPTATPTPSPSATPVATPTPQTPPAVQGVSPGMLAIVDLTTGFTQPVAAQTAVGSLERRFTLPIELSGVTMTINGVACGLKMVSRRQVMFVVPPAVIPSTTPYEVVINNNGTYAKGTVVIVPTRPDIFTFNEVPGPGGRARVFNATNRVLTREPFTVTTLRFRGGRRVPTVLRLYLTGVEGVPASFFTNAIRVGGVVIPAGNILTGAVLREPGVHTVDFTLPPTLDMAGDVPVIVQITVNGVVYSSRLDDTAPFFRIL